MAWFKTGGGALSETVLWTNPSPTSGFTSQSVNLSDNLTNYKFIKATWKISKSTSDEAAVIMSIDDFLQTGLTQSDFLFTLTSRISNNITAVRSCWYETDNKIHIGTGIDAGSSTTRNDNCIPLKVFGLK